MGQVTRYSAGFMFDFHDHSRVALIRKNRPHWQAGKLNAIGGHIEAGESPLAAMVREFHEETGYITHEADWSPFLVLQGDDHEVHFFTANGDTHFVRSNTDEHVGVYYVPSVGSYAAIPNLSWILPMAVEFAHGDDRRTYCVQGSY